MTTRIFLTGLSETGRVYISPPFELREPIYPRLHENGALMESEHDFLIALALQRGKFWHPMDPSRDPHIEIPWQIIEALWVQLEPGPGCYYKFTFKPPLIVIAPLPDINDPYR